MYRILVNATTFAIGGAHNVIESFIKDMINSDVIMNGNIIIDIVVSKKEYLIKHNNKNVNIIYKCFSNINIINKFIFEKIIFYRILNIKGYNAYLSLQNIGLNKINIPQFVFIQTPLPFSDIKKSESHLKYWLFMKMIYKININKYNMIFVQTKWMKDAIIDKYGYNGKVEVIRPMPINLDINVKTLPKYINDTLTNNYIKLFAPISTEKYKNGKFLINAINKYNIQSKKKVMLYVTLEGKNTKYIKYIGRIPYNLMYSFYKKVDALIFPSLAETLGLPLQEAQIAEIPIITSDLPYAKEICGNRALYFDPRNQKSLINVLNKFANGKNVKYKYNCNLNGDNYMKFINFIMEYLTSRKNN